MYSTGGFMGKQYTVLEINEQSLRIVVGRQYKSHALIQHVYTTTLPQNVWSEEETFTPTVFGPFLKDLFNKLALRNRRIIVSMVKQNLLSRVHQFPKTSIKDLEAMVGLYILDSFPVDINEYVLDYCILSSDAQHHLVRINVLKQASVKSLYDSLLGAGLEPIAFIPLGGSMNIALGQAKTLNHIKHDSNQSYGLFEYQGNTVNISLFQEGHLVFSRNVRAEISVETEEFIDFLLSTYTQQFRALAQRKYTFQRPDRFYLSGSTEDPLKTRELLEERLGKPVDVIRTLSTIRYSTPQPANIQLDIPAAGCLLSAPLRLQKKPTFFDFFYSFTQQKMKHSNLRALIGGVVAILIILLAFYSLSYRDRLEQSNQALTLGQQNLHLLQLEEEISGSTRAKLALAATEAYYEQLLSTTAFIANQPRVSSDQMLSLIEIMPPDIKLDALSVDPDRIFLSCNAKSRKSISEYEYLLKEASFVEEVFISYVASEDFEDESVTYTFTADCTIRQGGINVDS
jgi:type IV pilus assembly protein PilM